MSEVQDRSSRAQKSSLRKAISLIRVDLHLLLAIIAEDHVPLTRLM